MLNAVLAQQEQPRSGPHRQGPYPGVRLPVGGGCQACRKGKPSAEVEAGCLHRSSEGSQGPSAPHRQENLFLSAPRLLNSETHFLLSAYSRLPPPAQHYDL